MNKYWTIFKISFQQEFAYPMNFIMWRVRNIIQIFILFFLWDTVFNDPNQIIFGYDRVKIITYVFGVLVLKVFVFSARSVDVAGEISDGTLSNYILKPLNYFKYWATRDVASKALNLIFSIGEVFLLFILLKPEIFLQDKFIYWFSFIISLLIAMALLFIIRFIVSSVSFWFPEMAWGAQFLFVVVVIEFLSGAVFPIDVLPTSMQNVLYLTPFPYLLFFPLQIYLSKVPLDNLFYGMTISLSWIIILFLLMKLIWKKGIQIYRAEGR